MDPMDDIVEPTPPERLTVEEAPKVMRIGQQLACDLANDYLASDGSQGLPVIRFGVKRLHMSCSPAGVSEFPRRDARPRTRRVDHHGPGRDIASDSGWAGPVVAGADPVRKSATLVTTANRRITTPPLNRHTRAPMVPTGVAHIVSAITQTPTS